MKSKILVLTTLLYCVFLSSCDSGQLFGVTATPPPTITNTALPTSTTTSTSTPTFTPIPTATTIAIPECKTEVFSSEDLEDFRVSRVIIQGSDGERIIETDNGVSVSKIIYTVGGAGLGQNVIFELPGTYLILVDVKRGNFAQFSITVTRPTFELDYIFKRAFYPRDISDTEYTTIWDTFVIEKYSTLRVGIGASSTTNNTPNSSGKPIIVWVKNLKICLID